jgi:hypothetical protein
MPNSLHPAGCLCLTALDQHLRSFKDDGWEQKAQIGCFGIVIQKKTKKIRLKLVILPLKLKIIIYEL